MLARKYQKTVKGFLLAITLALMLLAEAALAKKTQNKSGGSKSSGTKSRAVVNRSAGSAVRSSKGISSTSSRISTSARSSGTRTGIKSLSSRSGFSSGTSVRRSVSTPTRVIRSHSSSTISQSRQPGRVTQKQSTGLRAGNSSSIRKSSGSLSSAGKSLSAGSSAGKRLGTSAGRILTGNSNKVLNSSNKVVEGPKSKPSSSRLRIIRTVEVHKKSTSDGTNKLSGQAKSSVGISRTAGIKDGKVLKTTTKSVQVRTSADNGSRKGTLRTLKVQQKGTMAARAVNAHNNKANKTVGKTPKRNPARFLKAPGLLSGGLGA